MEKYISRVWTKQTYLLLEYFQHLTANCSLLKLDSFDILFVTFDSYLDIFDSTLFNYQALSPWRFSSCWIPLFGVKLLHLPIPSETLYQPASFWWAASVKSTSNRRHLLPLPPPPINGSVPPLILFLEKS